jgi:hypothetical protein
MAEIWPDDAVAAAGARPARAPRPPTRRAARRARRRAARRPGTRSGSDRRVRVGASIEPEGYARGMRAPAPDPLALAASATPAAAAASRRPPPALPVHAEVRRVPRRLAQRKPSPVSNAPTCGRPPGPSEQVRRAVIDGRPGMPKGLLGGSTSTRSPPSSSRGEAVRNGLPAGARPVRRARRRHGPRPHDPARVARAARRLIEAAKRPPAAGIEADRRHGADVRARRGPSPCSWA